MIINNITHPLGTRARVLLSSVFGPYAQDDEYGSRLINPMELYHNQVTRVQGAFSLRMFHHSFGLMLIQSNIDAPSTLLDFPTLERFTEEIRINSYDIIGISAIIPNVMKVRKMCELIRKHQPGATIVVGGHVTNKGDIRDIIDADFICRGEGIRWFRRYLGQDEEAPIKHPLVNSCFGARILGMNLSSESGDAAAMLIPSVGCPVGCNFCSTSALFGGKGHFHNFYETGDELFSVMCEIEEKLKARAFFVMDENFLIHRKRALRLLELMEEHGKSWALFIFSSARVLKSYSMEQLVGLGISWVWMGLEGKESSYQKLKHVDTKSLVLELQSHGIRVLGSSIIGMENHKPEDMDSIIDHAVSHNTDFHQFMLYTPIPGTPLYEKHKQDGTLLPDEEFSPADAHGQYRFNYRHRHIKDNREEEYIIDAFQRDFEVNGPSLARLISTFLKGWKRYKDHPSRRIRDRFAWEVKPLRTTYAGAVWATRKYYDGNELVRAKMDFLLKDIYRTFGWKTRIIVPAIGVYAYWAIKREERRLACGWTYEPETYRCQQGRVSALGNVLQKNQKMPERINIRKSA
ncbi:MAG: cobalamin-dependent protein [Deltaproteobacteria bacterium]|nr:cobalamin-dependent protein [Deltaproteobacteria bacterium]